MFLTTADVRLVGEVAIANRLVTAEDKVPITCLHFLLYQWNSILNMIELDIRMSNRSLPMGPEVGVARVREIIERARMALREIENFIVLGIKVYGTSSLSYNGLLTAKNISRVVETTAQRVFTSFS